MANIEIGGRLHSTATGNVVTGANEVLDDTKNKKQNVINAEVDAAIGDDNTEGTIKGRIKTVEGDIETLNSDSSTSGSVAKAVADAKTELIGGATSGGNTLKKVEDKIQAEASARESAVSNEAQARQDAITAETNRATTRENQIYDLVHTPEQHYVTVATYADLANIASPSDDTIYRVSSYNGNTSQVDNTVYSEYGYNGTNFVFLCVKSQIDEVYDISAHHSNNTYVDLAAALDGGNNIPQELRKGGMSVKFVQSSDNKYVQFRYMGTSTAVADFTNVANWQGVEDEPVVGSKDLMESGGVANITKNYPTLLTPSSILSNKRFRDNGPIVDYNGMTLLIYSVTSNKAYDCKAFLPAGYYGIYIVAWYDNNNTFIKVEPYAGKVSESVTLVNEVVIAPSNAAYLYMNTISKYYTTKNRLRLITNLVLLDVGREGKPTEINPLRQRKVSLMGDSNWIFDGVTGMSSTRYCIGGVIEDVRDTWWGKLLLLSDAKLEINASLGSSSVTDNEYYGVPGYLSRVNTLGDPNCVIIGGGMNEPPTVEIGIFDPTKPIGELDTLVFADAYDKLVRLIKQYYSPEYMLMVIHPKTQMKFVNVMQEIAGYYGIEIANLRPVIDNVTYIDNVHYDFNGSQVVCEYILNSINKNNKLLKEWIKNNTVEEVVVELADNDVAGYLTDKNKSVIAKLMKSGAVEWLIENSKDIANNERFENIDEFLSYVSSEVPDNGNGVIKYLTDNKGVVIATINNVGDTEFKGGGGFDGEVTISRNVNFDAVKVLIGKNNAVVGWITSSGKVHIEELDVNKINVKDNTDIGIPAQLFPLLGIVADGTENHNFVNDKTLNLFFAQKGEYIKQGTRINTYPVISIHDDDAFDYQLPESYVYDANAETQPSSADQNKGGFASLLWPVLNALNKKHASTINGKITCSVSTEGQRSGLTSLYKMTDDFDGSLNTCGKMVKSLVQKEDWECLIHSMTARYASNSYLVEGIDSAFADSLLVDATYSGPNGLSWATTTCYDTVTKKNYKVKQDKSGWDECPLHYAKPYLATSKDPNSPCVINPTYSVKYQVKIWQDRALQAGLPFEKIVVDWGNSHGSWHNCEDMKYVNCVIFRQGGDGINTVPFKVCPTRCSLTVSAAENGITEHTDSYNVYNKYDYQRLCELVDSCVYSDAWAILRGHAYEAMYYNSYVSYFENLYGADSADCGALCYKDDNYPSEWILPLKYEELMDMIGDNIHDYWNNPPTRLNIQSWDEWYPCPGTTMAMIYDVLEYAISKGVAFRNTKEVLDERGNMFAIGSETFYKPSIDYRLPAKDVITSFCRISSNGSVVYESK